MDYLDTSVKTGLFKWKKNKIIILINTCKGHKKF